MMRRNWKRLQPTTLRHAMELCKEYARAKKNLSVERIADLMGLGDHWSLYKWIQSGRMPATLIRPYERVCGIDYITRFIAASAGGIYIDVPTGRNASATDMQELQELLNGAVGHLLQFYGGKARGDETLSAIQSAMTGLGWHRANVQKHLQPELELGGEP